MGFEGKRGFATAMSQDVKWSEAFDDLGEVYTIELTTHKAHSCCGHTFAAIDAVQDIVKREALQPEEIKTLKIGTYSTAVEICGNRDPKTSNEAKFSLPYAVALAASGRQTGPASFEVGVLN